MSRVWSHVKVEDQLESGNMSGSQNCRILMRSGDRMYAFLLWESRLDCET
jgi:hypothetical protein